ncbi:arylsulfatase [Streptomyces sp. NPDC050658]|uniref:arylsulfatase n=1 Tax=unclassified Streptomyces TaxID=2593676 RepID=UPI00342D3382
MVTAVPLALLHTSPVHVPVFDGLRDEDHPGVPLRHLVYEELLATARTAGPQSVAAQVRDIIEGAVADGAGAVLCTCSTIGGVAEATADAVGVPVLRVDRPMAAAVAAGRSVAVVASVHSTLEPTVALVEEEAARAGRPVDVTTLVVEGAWERFEAGDLEGYVGMVAEAVEALEGVDAVLLAQASLADVAGRVRTSVPVMSSPRSGLSAAVLRCGAGDAS